MGQAYMNAYKYLVGQPKGRYNLEDLSLEGRAVLKYIFKKTGRACMDWIQPAQYGVQLRAL
jgi:hypothetical protein